jgi:alkyl sulfatase BDS1-like metallo-beta-lactamase superfamily hydrolase
MTGPKPASQHTIDRNRAAAAMLSFDDLGDFAMAYRGLLATIEGGTVTDGGRVVWDCARHDFLRTDDPAPDSVHPGLWRQGRLNAVHGLFEVTDRVWQARGYDLSNLTFIAGDTGWILVDVLTTAPTARACLELANRTLGERPVRAVIYTHSHVDHFGGVLGVTSAEEVASGQVRIIAPDGFLAEVVNENVIAGAAMARRAMYQFGPFLPSGALGQVDNGLGKGMPFAASGLLAPTETITATGEELVVDGVRIVFQNTPDAEAPAEMNFFFPDLGALCMAENCTHNMHNLYPIRGAQTRDSLAWSKYVNEALDLWGADSDVMFATHHWPRFGNDDVQAFLRLQRDVYRWLHDQTMRLANLGHTPVEIAEALTLPDCFGGESHVQGYYGTVSHNVKSVYNKYLGWYDANPANLNPLPPTEAGARYVEFMGGADEVLRRARRSLEAGDYRWVAQVVNHVVFADPSNTEARELQADALEQLGYQAESGTWRNAYLFGAKELRDGPTGVSGRGRQLAHAMTAEQLFDSIGVRVDADLLGDAAGRINWVFTDLDEQHVLGIEHRAIHHLPDRTVADADATIATTRRVLAEVLAGQTGYDDAVTDGGLVVDGDSSLPALLFASLSEFTTFNIVEP